MLRRVEGPRDGGRAGLQGCRHSGRTLERGARRPARPTGGKLPGELGRYRKLRFSNRNSYLRWPRMTWRRSGAPPAPRASPRRRPAPQGGSPTTTGSTRGSCGRRRGTCRSTPCRCSTPRDSFCLTLGQVQRLTTQLITPFEPGCADAEPGAKTKRSALVGGMPAVVAQRCSPRPGFSGTDFSSVQGSNSPAARRGTAALVQRIESELGVSVHHHPSHRQEHSPFASPRRGPNNSSPTTAPAPGPSPDAARRSSRSPTQ